MSLKEELLSLYEKHYADLKAVLAEHPGENMDGPLLISPNQSYSKQPHRLMVIGQETNGWESDLDDLLKQMEHYEEFNVGEIYRSTPFWNITRKVEHLLGDQPYSCAWSNISKFDHNKGRAIGKFAVSIATVDHILREEIAILDPAICLFYTGPGFDSRLSGIFPGLKFLELAGYAEHQFAQLEHPNLPRHSYRTYHPQYLRMRGLEVGFLNFMEETVRKTL